MTSKISNTTPEFKAKIKADIVALLKDSYELTKDVKTLTRKRAVSTLKREPAFSLRVMRYLILKIILLAVVIAVSVILAISRILHGN